MKRFLIILIYLVFALVHPALTHAEDLAPVQSEGIAARGDERTDVKKRALDQAFKKAVSDALEALIKKESVTANPDALDSVISSNPKVFITNYRILAEGWVTHLEVPGSVEVIPDVQANGQTAPGVELYHIWIEASIDTGALRSALSNVIGGADQASQPVTLNLVGITDYNTYRSLVASLKRLPLLQDVAYSSFYRGRIVLTAKSAGSIQTLLERIAKEVSDGFIVMPGGGQTITIKPAPRPLA